MAGTNSTGILSTISDLTAAIGADPCLAAIVLVVGLSYWWSSKIHASMQKNNERRMDQILRATTVGAQAAQSSAAKSPSDH